MVNQKVTKKNIHCYIAPLRWQLVGMKARVECGTSDCCRDKCSGGFESAQSAESSETFVRLPKKTESPRRLLGKKIIRTKPVTIRWHDTKGPILISISLDALYLEQHVSGHHFLFIALKIVL